MREEWTSYRGLPAGVQMWMPPACFADSVFNADTSVHGYEGNTWGPNGVDKIDTPDEGRHDPVATGESEVETLL